jgi:hypothetical protein
VVELELRVTTSLGFLYVDGVELVSRQRRAHEYKLMTRMVRALPAPLRASVESICCDSKATWLFSVVVSDEAVAREVGSRLEAVAVRHCGGHNGIEVVEGLSGRRIWIEPNWDALARARTD